MKYAELKKLRDLGVAKYTCDEYTIEFHPPPPTAEEAEPVIDEALQDVINDLKRVHDRRGTLKDE